MNNENDTKRCIEKKVFRLSDLQCTNKRSIILLHEKRFTNYLEFLKIDLFSKKAIIE